MKTKISAASLKTKLASVRYETELSGMWSTKMNSRLMPRKKSRRRSRPPPTVAAPVAARGKVEFPCGAIRTLSLG
jgi:hypothetical protein